MCCVVSSPTPTTKASSKSLFFFLLSHGAVAHHSPVVGCRWAPGRAPSPRTLKELYLGPNGSLTAQQHLPG
ncbi:unnamed protein product [Arctogadus glacialis]